MISINFEFINFIFWIYLSF